MNLIENFKDLASDDRYIADLRDIVMNDTFYQPTESMFTIVPGIKGGQQVAAMKGFEYVTKKSAGCGGNGISPEFPAFEQKWNPTLQEVKIEYCYQDFEASFLQWGLNNGYDRKNLDGTALGLFIQDLVSKAMALDLQRIVLLADKDIAALNVLTDEATYAPFYNTIDKGLISTLVYLKTLPEFADAFVDLDANTGAMDDQLNLANGYAKDLYRKVVRRNYGFTGDLLLSSNELYLNYEDYLTDGVGPLQSNLDTVVNGLKNLRVSGQPITPIVHYDRWRAKDFVTGDPESIYLPHFALFTRKEYLQVGVDDTNSLTDIRMEYIGGSEEKFWIKANYMLDFKMTNPYAMKAAI
ncbi:hypothetical protein [Flavobacterium sedimenticola]|uniref:Phage major capsid protein n=1 Tax=Flavobacterium sedimenticola TaxID=3043286 RepID=A0ABT6XMM1_9FLAO|nr:hypothetical protein [Flavobacterium sedimenticola]MDI9256321.1 hypothetical protein [Flavobacterium sedimenticola]